MMKVKVAEAGGALHPDEIVVSVQTVNGTENLVVDRRTIENEYLEVGFPIREEGRNYLIELPRESQSGAWRVWVSSDYVLLDRERLTA